MSKSSQVFHKYPNASRCFLNRITLAALSEWLGLNRLEGAFARLYLIACEL